MEKRNHIIDILKGYGILLVIAGHSQVPYLTHFAFSFHMPLFFFISGYLSKEKVNNQQIKRNATKLLMPYLCSCLLITFFTLTTDYILGTHNISTNLLSAITGSGAPRIFFGKELCIGPLWFLLALFWIKLIHHLFCKFNVSAIHQAILFTLIIPIANSTAFYVTPPLSILPAIGGYGFYITGCLLKYVNATSLYKFIPFCIVVWIYCLIFSNMDINRCLYDSFYFIDLLGALGATFFFYLVVKKIYNSKSKIWKFLNWLGMYSIIAMSIHAIDQVVFVHTYHLWDCLYDSIPSVIVFLSRTIITIGLTYCIAKRTFFRSKIFHI